MTTLKQQIEEARYEIRAREAAIKTWQLKLMALEMERADCDHEFDPAPKGYEHEGGTCWRCGINQVYAECQKIGAQYK